MNPNGSLDGANFKIFDISDDLDRQGSMGSYRPHAAFGSAETGSLVIYMDVPYWSSSRYDIFGKFVKVEAPTSLPDLTGAWTAFSVSQKGGATIVEGAFNVQNIGTSNAGNFKVGYYLSDDDVSGIEDTLIKTQTLKSLSPGQSKTLRFSYRSEVPIVGKYIIVVVDSDNQVLESNEENNMAPPRLIQ